MSFRSKDATRLFIQPMCRARVSSVARIGLSERPNPMLSGATTRSPSAQV
jgi:hypothetical protein